MKKIDIKKVKAGDVIAVLSKADSDFCSRYYAQKKIVSDLTKSLLDALTKDEIKMNSLWKKYISFDDAIQLIVKTNLNVAIEGNKELVAVNR